ncbi:hypothetical protein HII36_09835 [Nonomuraea sp. NN258]|uniref:hypothetical protein n=1 Tax=Nonomuraea antri TaxID=2730852 RepID=UPI0015688F4A|nr:hypothetical protein [Nonomuraea antri]NRQ32136.1 hypothetical protein [Nonomuraea antri]
MPGPTDRPARSFDGRQLGFDIASDPGGQFQIVQGVQGASDTMRGLFHADVRLDDDTLRRQVGLGQGCDDEGESVTLMLAAGPSELSSWLSAALAGWV